MNVLISGASGLVGSHLTKSLSSQGHRTAALARASHPSTPPCWQPDQGQISLPVLNPFDAVVHLAGHPIACRWTKENKRKIRESRVEGTRLLVRALADSNPRPRVLISASATGFYGNRGDEWLDEQSDPGQGFLADVAQAWESSTAAAAEAGIRVVLLRFGIVLSPDGGALARLLPVFRLGAGGRVGNGRQYWSWITLPDLLNAITHCLTSEALSGPINAVSPQPVTNAEFTRTLGNALHRPTVIPLPKFAVRLALGEMADEALLSSARVRPRRLEESGFSYQHSDLETAWAALLG